MFEDFTRFSKSQSNVKTVQPSNVVINSPSNMKIILLSNVSSSIFNILAPSFDVPSFSTFGIVFT